MSEASRGCSPESGTGSSPSLSLRLWPPSKVLRCPIWWGRSDEESLPPEVYSSGLGGQFWPPQAPSLASAYSVLLAFAQVVPAPSLPSAFLLTLPAQQGGEELHTVGSSPSSAPASCGQIVESQLLYLSEGKNHNTGPACLPGSLWEPGMPRKAEGFF